MAYNHNYSFTYTHHKNGEETKWYQVVKFIKKHGAVSKKTIVHAIWEANACSEENIRGYQSSMFAQMNELHPEGVYYDKNLRMWTTYKFTNTNNSSNKKSKQKHIDNFIFEKILESALAISTNNANSIKQLERVIESMELSITILKSIKSKMKLNIN